MRNRKLQTSIAIVLTVSLLLGLGSGCCCENTHNNCGDFRLHPIFEEAIKGAIIGGVIALMAKPPKRA